MKIVSETKAFLQSNQQILLTKCNLNMKDNLLSDSQILIDLESKQIVVQQLYFLVKELIKQYEERQQIVERDFTQISDKLFKTQYKYKNQILFLQDILKKQQQAIAESQQQMMNVYDMHEKQRQSKNQKERQFQLLINERDMLKLSQINLENDIKLLKEQIYTIENAKQSLQLSLQNQTIHLQNTVQVQLRLLKQLKQTEQQLAISKITIAQLKTKSQQLQTQNKFYSDQISSFNHNKDKENLHWESEESTPLLEDSPREVLKDLINLSPSNNYFIKFSTKSQRKITQITSYNNSKKLEYNLHPTQNKIQIEEQEISQFHQDHLHTQYDPYHCFFLLLVQCAKLNSKKFLEVADKDMNRYWEILINTRLPMNKWSEYLQFELHNNI